MDVGDEGERPAARAHAAVLPAVRPVAATAITGFVGWLALAAMAVGLGMLVTHFVVGHALGHGDLEVARWFAERRTPTWNAVSRVGSYLAETLTVLVWLAVVLGVLARRRAWPQCGLLVVAMAAEGGVYLVATYFVTRDRPAVPRLEHLIVTDSYPSGHTAAAVALYGSLCIVVWSLTSARAWRVLFSVLAVVCPLAVATSRVYRGMHNVSDVACGLLIGAGCIVVGYVAVRVGLAVAETRAPEERRVEDGPGAAPRAPEPGPNLVHGVVR